VSTRAFDEEFPITGDGRLDLITFLSNEFGTSRSISRMQVTLSEITIGGEKWEGDQFFLPIDLIKGKEITVVGRDRHWKFTYPA
jgi:hypothetical protein